MDIWSPLHITIWTVMSILCVFSREVTVKSSDLRLCTEDEKVCVTDLRDCGPRPPSSVQKTLNMLCYYQMSYMSYESITCELSQELNSYTEPDIALIFSRNRVFSCQGIFNPSAVLNITARIKDFMMGTEIRSQPHTVCLHRAVKPSQPVLTVLGSNDDSVVVSWRSSSDGSCRLHYRVNDTRTWSQPPDFPVYQDQTLVYTIKDLLPFTIYKAAMACRGRDSGIWSSWSPDITVRTLDRVPSKPPEVCYRLERDSNGSLVLHLMWKGLDLYEAGGHILGYQVSYELVKKQGLQHRLIRNVTDVMEDLVVEEGNCTVTVTAFNTAGFGPAAQLSIDTQRQNNLPSVTNLWINSSFPDVKSLQVQWESPTAPPSALPVNHFVVQWRLEMNPSTSHWSTVDGFNTSIVVQDVDPDEPHLVSVFPVYKQQCGSPQSLPASLEQGALMEAVKLEVVNMTKTLVTVKWAWQRKSRQIRVNEYTVILTKNSERQKTVGAVSLRPYQWQHTFSNLMPGTEYSLLLLADDESRAIVPFRTGFDEVPVVATVTPLLLLAVTVLVICILSRTVYRPYFFPPISSPRGSSTGQWLVDPNHKKYAERTILDIKDFQVTDVLGEKGVIAIGSDDLLSSDEDLHEDTSLLPLSHLVIKLSALELDTEYVSDTPLTPEHQLQSYHPDCVVKCHHPDQVFISEEREEADAPLLRQIPEETNFLFPRKEEETRQLNLSQTSHQSTVKCSFRELKAHADSLCANHMTCEAEYLENSSFLRKTDVETVTGRTGSYLICETDYIANNCFTDKTADEERASGVSIAC
ncbi:interleukin-6 receptor subunit beta isoform X2 [Trachinotus anak]|uniref:interleukin-6 receptor subunit beta isoform X2 n=1 Tax=Trachinotus anak TaxID=443729 RepID=UPI0039F1AB00